MKFSERLGFKTVKDQFQINTIDDDLKNSIWSIYYDLFLNKIPNWERDPSLTNFVRELWFNYFKKPIDTLPSYDYYIPTKYISRIVREYYFDTNRQWYEIYDLLEFSGKYASKEYFEIMNKIFEREKSAFRFLDRQLVQITSKEEIEEIEDALQNSNKFQSVKTHLSTALSLLSDRKNPDYRNSIKESISAVESICKIFTNNDKSTLGEALTKLEKEFDLHPALKKSFSSLYGYTSDNGGIRHALIENDRAIDFHEAKFMLVTCSAFTNYLISKM